MPSSATPIDERSLWQFGLEVDGLEQLYVQKVTIPKVAAVTRKRGQAGRQMNVPITSGKVTVEDLVLEKVMPANESDQWAWELLMRAIDEPVRDVIFDFTLVEYDREGDEGRVIDRWHYSGFVSDVDPGERDVNDEEGHIVETVTIKITAVPSRT